MNCPPDTNPKSVFGTAKPGFHAIPPVALLHCGRGMEDGEVKYGLTNWREHEVSASVYYDAALRHLMSWWDGEQVAADSGVHHLGHTMACCAILLDAEHMGKLNDDRPSVPGPFAEAVKALTRAMKDETVQDWIAAGMPETSLVDADFAEIEKRVAATLEPAEALQQKREAEAALATLKAKPPELSADQILKKVQKLLNDPETSEKRRQRAIEFLDAEGVNKARELPAHRLADLLTWVEMGDKAPEVAPAEHAVVFDLIHDTGTIRDDRVSVVIRDEISATDLDALIAEYLRKRPGENAETRFAVFNNFRAHIGSQNHGQYSQNNRTRLAFYIEARLAGVSHTAVHLDDFLSLAGFEFGRA